MPHNDDDDDDRLDLRFVSQLKEYCFSGLKHHHFGSFEQYASGNDRLKRIGWHASENGNGMMNTMPPDVLNGTDAAFAAKFTHLDLDKELLRKVKLDSFANVTTVMLDVVNVNSDDLIISAYFRPLVQQLKQLIHLKVSLWVDDLARPDFVPQPPPKPDDNVLRTVKVLTLQLVGSKYYNSNDDNGDDDGGNKTPLIAAAPVLVLNTNEIDEPLVATDSPADDKYPNYSFGGIPNELSPDDPALVTDLHKKYDGDDEQQIIGAAAE